MQHFYFQFDFFKPARRVFGLPPQPKYASAAPPKKKEEVADGLTKAERVEMQLQAEFKEIDAEFYDKLAAKKDEIQGFINSLPAGTKGQPNAREIWEGWGSTFANIVRDEFVGPDDTIEDKQLVVYLQKVIFRKLRMEGYENLSKIATVKLVPDGIMGPDTVSALALYLGLELPAFLYENGEIKIDSSKDKQLSGLLKYADQENALEAMRVLGPDKLYEMYRTTVETEPEQLSPALDTEFFYEKIDDILIYNQGRIDTSTVGGWRRAFEKAGLSQEEIDRLGLNPHPLSAEEVAQMKALEEEKNLKKTQEESKKREAKNRAKLSSALQSHEKWVDSLFSDTQEENIREDFETAKDQWISWMVNDLNDIPVINAAWQDYDRIYTSLEAAYEKGLGWQTLEPEKDKAYKHLKEVIDGYYKGIKALKQELMADYQKDLQALASHYAFPEDAPLEEFTNKYEAEPNSSVYRKWHWESQSFRTNKLGEAPIKYDIKDKADLEKIVVGDTPNEKQVNVEEIWKEAMDSGRSPVSVINSWIYVQNEKHFAPKYVDLLVEKRSLARKAREAVDNGVYQLDEIKGSAE